MMVALVPPFATVGLGQLDPALLHAINRADMHAVGPDDFHMVLDPARIHGNGLRCTSGQRAGPPSCSFLISAIAPPRSSARHYRDARGPLSHDPLEFRGGISCVGLLTRSLRRRGVGSKLRP